MSERDGEREQQTAGRDEREHAQIHTDMETGHSVGLGEHKQAWSVIERY